MPEVFLDKTSTARTPTRQALLDAALAVFAERGFAGATTREIAQRAGLSEGTMYRHFADKQELFHQVVFSLVVDIVAELGRLPDKAGQATLRDNLAHIFTLIGQMQSKLAAMMASVWADSDLRRSFDSFAGERMAAGFERPEPVTMVAEYLAAEQTLGRVRPDVDPGQAAAVVVAIPFASGMERALWTTFGPGQEAAATEDFPVPAEDALRILVRGLTP